MLRAAQGQGHRRGGVQPATAPASRTSSSRRRRWTRSTVHSMGYGMTAAADGRWFPWVFNFPTTYWSQASAVIRYIGQQEGGLDKLKGKKIVHVYHNSPYGKEANPDARGAGPQVRLRADAARGGPPRPGAEVHVAAGAADQPRLDVPVGLGRDEPGGGEGGGRDQLPDGPPHRQLVVGQRGGRGAGGRRRQGLQGRDVPRPGQQLQGPRRHRQARLRQGQEHGPEGQRSARPSTTAASSTPCSRSRPSAPRWASSATSR